MTDPHSRGFLEDPTVWKTVSGVGAPKITFLKEIGEFSR
jgi:hypothetical protein